MLRSTRRGSLPNPAPRKRAASKRRGLVLVLEGSQPSVAESLRIAAIIAMQRCKLGRQARPLADIDAKAPSAIVDILSLTAEKAKVAKLDRIIILWDDGGQNCATEFITWNG